MNLANGLLSEQHSQTWKEKVYKLFRLCKVKSNSIHF